jgi:hypothetical protein
VCGGINAGKSTFSRYLQLGKKNVFRVCKEELNYSVGFGQRDGHIVLSIASMLIKQGDVVLDDISYNRSATRVKAIKALKTEFIDVYAYIIKRPVDQCYDEYHTKKSVEYSHKQMEFPTLKEGITKVISVNWEDSTEPLDLDGEKLMTKPKLSIIHQAHDDRPIIVKPKKKAIKHKFRQDRRTFSLKDQKWQKKPPK